jgi:sarcosine oxidase subunit beta
MDKIADVVVIGGGINGCSIAYHLARRGVKNVLLVEKGHIASGPTGRSSGIVRQHYSIETLAMMARDSLRVFQRFKDEVGGDAGFVQSGAVFFCSGPDAPTLRKTVEMHQRLGIRDNILTAVELKDLEPQLVTDDISCAAYEPDAGYADPALAANSFCEAARSLGVEVQRKTAVTGIRLEGGQIRGVLTDRGEISTDTAINVAGPWARAIAAMAGIEIPISPGRHPVVILQRPPQWRGRTPVWADLITGWYFKPEGQHAMMAGCLSEVEKDRNVNIETHATNVHYEETVKFSEATLRRFPVMEQGLAQGGWAGIYDMTPGGQPVIDRIEEVPGFYCACGFSGHGFKLAPAVGRIMSDLVLEGSCASYDIRVFRHTRFREGELTRSAYAYGIIG